MIDSLKALPFLLGVYLLIEYMEHRQKNPGKGLAKYGVLGGALLGCIPQCGFSVVAASLYSRGLITTGTLLAVFLSTSDEALPLLISQPEQAGALAAVIACKIAVAMAAGFLVDLCTKKKKAAPGPPADDFHERCESAPNDLHIFLSALRHTLLIFLFLLGVTLALNIALSFLGQDALDRLLISHSPFQAAVTSLFGLIPNCAPSVILTGFYLSDSIGFGSLIGGLLTGAGLGLLTLFRVNPDLRQNLRIIALLYGIGAAMGILLNWLAL